VNCGYYDIQIGKSKQREEVESMCQDDVETFVWIAEEGSVITGFIAYTRNSEEKSGKEHGTILPPS
jgi:hypothetical protein